jgi:hypothetical protein
MTSECLELCVGKPSLTRVLATSNAMAGMKEVSFLLNVCFATKSQLALILPRNYLLEMS